MRKSRVFYLNNHVMVLSGDNQPAPHAHLATQITVSLDGPTSWRIDDCSVVASAVCIGGGVEHFCPTPGEYLSLLFIKTSGYAHLAETRLLQGTPFVAFSDEGHRSFQELVEQNVQAPETLSRMILDYFGLAAAADPEFDPRIGAALKSLEGMDGVPEDILKLLSNEACLSQSRFSHLFRQETGMSIAGYLAFEKLRKTCRGMRAGKNITQAAMDAGFSTPSHCAASCTRMFGLSLKKISWG